MNSVVRQQAANFARQRLPLRGVTLLLAAGLLALVAGCRATPCQCDRLPALQSRYPHAESAGRVVLAAAPSGRVVLPAAPSGRVRLAGFHAKAPQRDRTPATTTPASSASQPAAGRWPTTHQTTVLTTLRPVSEIFEDAAPAPVPPAVPRMQLSHEERPAANSGSREGSAGGMFPHGLLNHCPEAGSAGPRGRRCCSQRCCCSGCCRRPSFSFRSDYRDFLPRLADDAAGVARGGNLLILGASLAAAIGIRQDLDGQVRESTARHPERWGEASATLGTFGEVQYQVPALLALYGYSLHRQDPVLHDMMTSMLSAYTLTGLGTLAIKGISNTERPSDDWNDGEFGFPSFHVASTMTIAAVAQEYYGWRAGVPLYGLAGLIGWSRIDERDHDLSDVVFGAALGWVIGHSVASRSLTGDSRVQLSPWFSPTHNTRGVMLEWPY